MRAGLCLKSGNTAGAAALAQTVLAGADVEAGGHARAQQVLAAAPPPAPVSAP
ncbi:hypothetical protein HQ590_04710 [bacterium]|nr:hypothetical protein [bacterium]